MLAIFFSACLQAELLFAKYPSVHKLDCSALDSLAKDTVQTIANLKQLCDLRIQVEHRQADEMLAMFAELTNLTCLHFHTAEVIANAIALPRSRLLVNPRIYHSFVVPDHILYVRYVKMPFLPAKAR